MLNGYFGIGKKTERRKLAIRSKSFQNCGQWLIVGVGRRHLQILDFWWEGKVIQNLSSFFGKEDLCHLGHISHPHIFWGSRTEV